MNEKERWGTDGESFGDLAPTMPMLPISVPLLLRVKEIRQVISLTTRLGLTPCIIGDHASPSESVWMKSAESRRTYRQCRSDYLALAAKDSHRAYVPENVSVCTYIYTHTYVCMCSCAYIVYMYAIRNAEKLQSGTPQALNRAPTCFLSQALCQFRRNYVNCLRSP